VTTRRTRSSSEKVPTRYSFSFAVVIYSSRYSWCVCAYSCILFIARMNVYRWLPLNI
jgi:sugar phosphate permease